MRQRIGLVFLFSLGGLVVVASLIRIATLTQLLDSTNPTMSLVSPYNWSTIEVHTGIFITYGPAFKAFVRSYIPQLLGNSSYRRSAGDSRTRPDHHDSHYGSYPLHSPPRADGTKTVIAAVGPKQPETESEENIILPSQGIIAETSINVDVRDTNGASANAASHQHLSKVV
jgi:hypothetical protein